MKRKFIICLLIVSLIVNAFLIYYLKVNYVKKYSREDDFMGSYVHNISPYYDFEKLVDYEGSRAISYEIDEKLGLEIGKAILLSVIRSEFGRTGEKIADNDIFENMSFKINCITYEGVEAYEITAKIKNKIISYTWDKIWRDPLCDIAGENGISVIIEKTNGKILNCKVRDKISECNIDEKCASDIGKSISKRYCLMLPGIRDAMLPEKYWDKFISLTYSYISDAIGIAREGESEDEFFEVEIRARISMNRAATFFEDIYIDYLKNTRNILIRKSNAEIIKVW